MQLSMQELKDILVSRVTIVNERSCVLYQELEEVKEVLDEMLERVSNTENQKIKGVSNE